MAEANQKGGEFLALALIEALDLLFDFQNTHGGKLGRGGGASTARLARETSFQPSQAASFSMRPSRVGR